MPLNGGENPSNQDGSTKNCSVGHSRGGNSTRAPDFLHTTAPICATPPTGFLMNIENFVTIFVTVGLGTRVKRQQEKEITQPCNSTRDPWRLPEPGTERTAPRPLRCNINLTKWTPSWKKSAFEHCLSILSELSGDYPWGVSNHVSVWKMKKTAQS